MGGGSGNAAVTYNYHYGVDFSVAQYSSLYTGGIYNCGYTQYGYSSYSSSNATNSGSTAFGAPSVSSTRKFLQKIANEIDSKISGNGHVVGTAKHKLFRNAIEAANNPYIGTEVAYLNSAIQRGRPYGCVVFDVVLYSDLAHLHAVAAFDLKTGSAILTASRIASMQSQSGLTDTPIYAIYPR